MKNIQVYNDVVKNGLILAKKEKYTMRDFRKICKDFDQCTALFILTCSAMYHYGKEYYKHMTAKMQTNAFFTLCQCGYAAF